MSHRAGIVISTARTVLHPDGLDHVGREKEADAEADEKRYDIGYHIERDVLSLHSHFPIMDHTTKGPLSYGDLPRFRTLVSRDSKDTS